MQTKFDMGDKVRVLDGSNIPEYLGDWNPVMSMAIGMTGTVNAVMACSDGRVGYFLDCLSPLFDERGLEKVEEKAPEPYNGKIILQRAIVFSKQVTFMKLSRGKSETRVMVIYCPVIDDLPALRM